MLNLPVHLRLIFRNNNTFYNNKGMWQREKIQTKYNLATVREPRTFMGPREIVGIQIILMITE